MSRMLVKYVRDTNKHPRGKIIAGLVQEGFWSIGWSLCHKHDEFNPHIAHKICLSRLLHDDSPATFYSGVPDTLVKEITKMYSRATRYFKGAKPLYPLDAFIDTIYEIDSYEDEEDEDYSNHK